MYLLRIPQAFIIRCSHKHTTTSCCSCKNCTMCQTYYPSQQDSMGSFLWTDWCPYNLVFEDVGRPVGGVKGPGARTTGIQCDISALAVPFFHLHPQRSSTNINYLFSFLAILRLKNGPLLLFQLHFKNEKTQPPTSASLDKRRSCRALALRLEDSQQQDLRSKWTMDRHLNQSVELLSRDISGKIDGLFNLHL